MKQPVLHAVTTGRMTTDETVSICLDILPYIDAIHIREHLKTAREVYELGKTMLEQGIPNEKLVINNRVDVAAALGIDRVQLGYHSLTVQVVKQSFPQLFIGKSVHSLPEALLAEEEGADGIIYGHVFQTDSKNALAPRGLAELSSISEKLSIPVTAIGGILPSNMEEVFQTGCSGIAVMSGIFNAKDPIQSAIQYQKQLEMIADETHL
ncbi:thiazole tautomerase TenI [Bacillus salacetis]|uniref:thiazole tautomerase TenI n=1 Tax=Bacillus salacetis TaxID=2315464 RepID=UPI003B9E07B0